MVTCQVYIYVGYVFLSEIFKNHKITFCGGGNCIMGFLGTVNTNSMGLLWALSTSSMDFFCALEIQTNP